MIGMLWVALHLMGLLATWMLRINCGNRYEAVSQGSFLIFLSGVALATVVGQFCCLEFWPLSAVTLALMIVMAVMDLGTSRSIAA